MSRSISLNRQPRRGDDLPGPPSLQAVALNLRNQRVEAYRDLVRPLAIHYARRCSESWEDLQQVGLLGLIRASELYRPDAGTPFAAFARPHIRGAILHYLRDEAPSVRLPRRQAELQEKVQRLSRDLAAEPDSSAAATRIRDRLGISEEQLQLLLQHRRLCRPLPLEQLQLEEVEAATAWEPQERLTTLRELLDELDPRQGEVVRQVVLAGSSYRQIAAGMGISPMTVQRLLQRGLARLREQLAQRQPPLNRRKRLAGSGPQGC